MKKGFKPSHPLAIRVFAIVLAILVTGGLVTYLGMFLINLFQG